MSPQWTKAAFLNKVGKRTPLFLRFSIVAADEGAPDTDRDVRGVAVKFYTEEGNYDIVGNNTPVFFVRDPMKFPDFIHSQLRLPDTGMRSNNMQWDFWTLSPESAHQVTYLMSDRGTPRTWRNMNFYASDTYMWENAGGKKFWVKYHFKTEQGVQNFTDAEAKAMFVEDLDYHRRDLREAIARKDYPAWRLEMQIMPFEDAANYRFNPFDVTKVWPHKDYPLIPIGRLVLDRNPDNFFAQVTQVAFEVSNFVPGIGPSPDRMVLGRMFAYGDSARYRNGPNYMQLPVNRPLNEVHNYNKDGPMCYRHNGDQPVYAPNSYGGPKADPQRYRDPSWFVEGAEIMRTAYEAHQDDNDFIQPGTLYRAGDDADRSGPSSRQHRRASKPGGGALHPGARGQRLLDASGSRPRRPRCPRPGPGDSAAKQAVAQAIRWRRPSKCCHPDAAKRGRRLPRRLSPTISEYAEVNHG